MSRKATEMSRQNSRLLLINGLILGAVALVSFNLDLLGYFYGLGMTGPALHGNLDAIAYTEAHGLAAIVSLLLVLRRHDGWIGWHAVAAGMHLLLGLCNLVFFEVFVTWELVGLGVAATALHIVFFTLQTVALARALLSPPSTSEKGLSS